MNPDWQPTKKDKVVHFLGKIGTLHGLAPWALHVAIPERTIKHIHGLMEHARDMLIQVPEVVYTFQHADNDVFLYEGLRLRKFQHPQELDIIMEPNAAREFLDKLQEHHLDEDPLIYTTPASGNKTRLGIDPLHVNDLNAIYKAPVTDDWPVEQVSFHLRKLSDGGVSWYLEASTWHDEIGLRQQATLHPGKYAHVQ